MLPKSQSKGAPPPARWRGWRSSVHGRPRVCILRVLHAGRAPGASFSRSWPSTHRPSQSRASRWVSSPGTGRGGAGATPHRADDGCPAHAVPPRTGPVARSPYLGPDRQRWALLPSLDSTPRASSTDRQDAPGPTGRRTRRAGRLRRAAHPPLTGHPHPLITMPTVRPVEPSAGGACDGVRGPRGHEQSQSHGSGDGRLAISIARSRGTYQFDNDADSGGRGAGERPPHHRLKS